MASRASVVLRVGALTLAVLSEIVGVVFLIAAAICFISYRSGVPNNPEGMIPVVYFGFWAAGPLAFASIVAIAYRSALSRGSLLCMALPGLVVGGAIGILVLTELVSYVIGKNN